MSTRSEAEGAGSLPGTGRSRVRQLEAEVADLRAALAEREGVIDRLQERGFQDSQIRLVADSLPVLISYVDAEQRYRYNNKAHEGWFGGKRRDIFGRHLAEMLGPEAYERVRPLAEAALRGERVSADVSLPDEMGGLRHVHLEYVPDRRPDDSVLGFYALVQDISESKRAEAELRESEARFRAMADSAPAPVWVTDERGIEFANRALSEFTGLSFSQLLGDAWMRLCHPDDLAEVQARRERAWRDRAPYGFEARFRRHDGEWRWLRATCKPREPDGAFPGYVGMALDVTESRRTEDALRESEARFREVANAAPVLIWLADTENRGIWYNKAWLDFTGRPMEQELGHGWIDGVHPDDRVRCAEICGSSFERHQPFRLDFRLRRADGEWRVMDDSAVPRFAEDGTFLGYIGCCVDVTDSRRAEEALRELNQSLETRIAAAVSERERAEEALRQAQKMEAVGQLTGGIAHDFNNLLTVISGNLDMAARRLGNEADPRVQRAIGSALVGAERAATLTQRLLAFSRRQPLAPKAIDPNALLASMTDLLHRTLGETVEVETRLAGGLWRIEADPHQLESAILNLAVNARDAMPDGGRLVIETSAVRLRPEDIVEGEDLAPGAYVMISVSDTGVGMNEETRLRAVEPFFTTKEVGKGTGLGLSMVYGFVKQSGGHLQIESEEGRGTRIHIYLPRMSGESLEEEQAEAAAAPRGAGDETILVCEDDDDVRTYTVELLEELGYAVLQAHDGTSTLQLLRDPLSRIDLLFTDVVLPGGMSGAELAQQAREVRPGLKVLYTTGYARDAIVHEGRLDPGIELVTKPFSFAELASRIREVLDAPRSAR